MIRANAAWLLGRLGYWARPYDLLLGARRWRWQRRGQWGRQVMASMPPLNWEIWRDVDPADDDGVAP